MCELQRPVTQIPSILLFSIYVCFPNVTFICTYNEHEQRQPNNTEVKPHYVQGRWSGTLHKLA